MTTVYFRTTREVAAPIEAVWRTMGDTARYSDWVPRGTEVVATDGPARPGSTYTERSIVVEPVKANSLWEVVEYDEPRWQRHRSTSIPILKHLDITLEVETLAPDRTRFTLSWQGESALGPLGAAVVRLQKPSLARELEETADRLAAASAT